MWGERFSQNQLYFCQNFQAMGEQYQFPETNKFKAREVLEVDFDVRKYERSNLYVPLDQARGTEYRDELLYLLGVEQDELKDTTPSYLKVIFSGHRGCGKSLELYRIHQYLLHPDRYQSVFIDMEREIEIARFEPEDFFVTLISKLVELCRNNGIDADLKALDRLASEWVSEEEIKREFSSDRVLSAEASAKAGFSFWKWLSLDVGVKSFFTGKTSTSRVLREKIKQEPLRLLDRLNSLIEAVRSALRGASAGRDLLFIFDGTEKIRYDIYLDLFVKNSFLIRGLQANMIYAVPINAAYDIQAGVTADSYERVMLPMFKINDSNEALFSEIIARRVSTDTFFEPVALRAIVYQSGGCPRQLLKIAATTLRKSLGKKAGPIEAEAAFKMLGQEMFEKLDKGHVETLRTKAYQHADEDVKDLLFSLAILKYNGERKVNPLLEKFIG